MKHASRLFAPIGLGLLLTCNLCWKAAADEENTAPEPIRVSDAQPDEAMNGHFTRSEGWIGGDGINSVPLPDDSVLWIFGDTLVGDVQMGRRHNLAMVNNSFARQRGWGSAANVELFFNRNAAGAPTSYITPENQDGYFWLWDGIVIQGKLYVFATRQTSPGTITAFDWKLMDQSLIVVDNPLDPPAKWTVKQLKLPFGEFTDSYEALWGLEVLDVADGLLVYGTVRGEVGEPRSLVVARVAPHEILDFARWTFYRDGEWQGDQRAASSLATHVGTEGSVTRLADRGRYVYVYSPPLDPRILMRTAASPVGPWSEAVSIYTCPEAKWDPRIFCYAGKARLIPGSESELLISYATNSFEMLPHVTADPRIYMPRFVRARLAD